MLQPPVGAQDRPLAVDVPFWGAAKVEMCLRASPAPHLGQVAVALLALIGTSRSRLSFSSRLA